MDSLCNLRQRNGSDFLKKVIIPMSFKGLGSVNELLSMKIYELVSLSWSVTDDDMEELFIATHFPQFLNNN